MLDVVVHACNLNTWEAGAGQAGIQGHPELPSKLDQLGLHEFQFFALLISVFPHRNDEIETRTCAHTCSRRSLVCFLAARTRNNSTETVLIKSLLGPLALASYWLILTS